MKILCLKENTCTRLKSMHWPCAPAAALDTRAPLFPISHACHLSDLLIISESPTRSHPNRQSHIWGRLRVEEKSGWGQDRSQGGWAARWWQRQGRHFRIAAPPFAQMSRKNYGKSKKFAPSVAPASFSSEACTFAQSETHRKRKVIKATRWNGRCKSQQIARAINERSTDSLPKVRNTHMYTRRHASFKLTYG